MVAWNDVDALFQGKVGSNLHANKDVLQCLHILNKRYNVFIAYFRDLSCIFCQLFSRL